MRLVVTAFQLPREAREEHGEFVHAVEGYVKFTTTVEVTPADYTYLVEHIGRAIEVPLLPDGYLERLERLAWKAGICPYYHNDKPCGTCTFCQLRQVLAERKK